jgi:20S proteasome alpha/beta subunit
MSEKIKTGTTCIGLKYKDGILLAADMRVTSYKIDSERFQKIFEISKNMALTVSGGAADAQRYVRYIKSELKLIEFKAERIPLVSEAAMILSNYQFSGIRTSGSIVGFILGGYDNKDGFSLYNLSVDGTIVPNEGFVTSGSGSIFIQGILDNEYNPKISKEEGIKLIEKCFYSAFKNDNASGGGFIIKDITKDGVKTELIKELNLNIN